MQEPFDPFDTFLEMPNEYESGSEIDPKPVKDREESAIDYLSKQDADEAINFFLHQF